MIKKRSSSYTSPSGIESILHSALKKRRLDRAVEKYAAFPYWPEIVGEDIAKIATPEKIIRGNILVVRVLDAAWVQELTLRKPEFLNALHQANIGAAIEDIHFVAGNPRMFKGA